MPIAEHAMVRLVDSSPIARSVAQRRALVQTVYAKIGAPLLAFGLADNHLHLLLACLRALAGRLVKNLELSLRRRLPVTVPFAPAFFKPVEDAWHLYRAFRYVLRQPERHQLEVDPLREASNLPDLLGLRTVGSYTAANVRRLLPRIGRRDLLELVAVKDLQSRDAPVEWVVEATLAATALPALSGSSHHAQRARRAALEVIGRRLPRAQIAACFGVSERMVSRMRLCPANAALVEAIGRQLHLMAQVPRENMATFVAAPSLERVAV
jgi:hypothetical protein